MRKMSRVLKIWVPAVVGLALLVSGSPGARAQGVVLKGKDGPGKGKHVVFVIGDDEYRSEDGMPQLAKILAQHHGFTCTLLFSLNEAGEIDPSSQENIPGLEALQTADLMVLFTRFRELPDSQMKHIIDYTNSGRPIIGLRTATHAFNYSRNPASPYAKYSFRSKDPDGGWGRQVLGETWINHYGHHKKESTRGVVVKGKENHPIVRGVGTIWGPSDVYGLTELSGDSDPLVMGLVLKSMEPDDEPNTEKPPLPVAWTKTFKGTQGKTARVFTTTMGHAHDLKCPNFRRLLVNAVYWSLGMEDKIPAESQVDLVGEYDPNPIGNKTFKTGLKPEDHQL
jgi:type 1 glutamine amidotransferase